MSRHAEILSGAENVPEKPEVIRGGKSTRIAMTPPCRTSSMDEVRKVVHGVFLSHKNGDAPHVVVFCGANRGVGASWVCARTGESLARESAGTVCLIDANLRAPSLHMQLNVSNTAGFADMSENSGQVTDFAQRISTNLWVVTAGTQAAGSSAPLNTEALTRRCAELRNAFDFLLIDTPAMDVSSDAVIFGRFADGIVLVVASDSTRRETARSAKASFEVAQIRVVGAVLNKRVFPIPDAIYWKI